MATTLKAKEPRERRSKRKKFITYENGIDAYYETVEEKYLAESNEASRSFTELATGINSKRLCTVKITGIREGGKHRLCALATYRSKESPSDEPVQVIIPYDEFADMTDEELLKANIFSRKIYMERQIGNVVDIIPTGFDREYGEVYFIGSRLAAMKKKAWEYWFALEAGTGAYKFKVGSLISARINFVGEKNVFIEIFGVTSKVRDADLAYVWVEDARERFKKGDTVLTRITSLNRQEDDGKGGFHVSYTASIKAAQKDPHETAATLIHKGDLGMGRIVRNVSYKDGNGFVIVRPVDREIDVYCSYPGEDEGIFSFKNGSEVIFRYAQPRLDNDGRWRIFGNMRHVIKY